MSKMHEVTLVQTDRERREGWYVQRSYPIFCNCCRAIYQCVYPAKTLWLLLGVALWILGLILILAVIIACIAGHCSELTAGLTPVAILLMFIGYGLFHCAWAAYLLDEPDTEPYKRAGDLESSPMRDGTPVRGGEPFFETANEPELQNGPSTGYWQFAQKEAWQAVSTRDTLN